VQNECLNKLFACGCNVPQWSVVTNIGIDALLTGLLRFFFEKTPANRLLAFEKRLMELIEKLIAGRGESIPALGNLASVNPTLQVAEKVPFRLCAPSLKIKA